MAVYYIIYQNITDPDRFMEYVQAVMPAIAQRGGRMIAEGIPETVEGALSWQRAVVFEWPSRQHLVNLLRSDSVKTIRERPALMIEGMKDPTLLAKYFIPLFQEAFPYGIVHQLEETGHYCYEDSPEIIAPLIEQFILLAK